MPDSDYFRRCLAGRETDDAAAFANHLSYAAEIFPS